MSGISEQPCAMVRPAPDSQHDSSSSHYLSKVGSERIRAARAVTLGLWSCATDGGSIDLSPAACGGSLRGPLRTEPIAIGERLCVIRSSGASLPASRYPSF